MNFFNLSKFLKKYNYLILDLTLHFLFTLIGAFLIWNYSYNPIFSLMFVLGGIFIDLDHLIDYFLYFKFSFFDIKKFLKGEYMKSGKIFLFLHSWELVLLLYLISYLFMLPEIAFLAFGMTIHLIIDNYKRHKKAFYLIFYRAANNFQIRKILPEY